MKQMMLADAEYTGKSQQTHKELFLIEMHQVLPWKGSLLELHYPESEGSRSSYSLAAILRIHLIQSSFGYDDPAMEYTFYETTILRQSAGMNTDCIPEEVILFSFSRLLEKYGPTVNIFCVINGKPDDRGLSLRQDIVFDGAPYKVSSCQVGSRTNAIQS